jgi:hypothetical protein
MYIDNLIQENICKSSQRPLCYHNRLYKCILTTLYKKTFVNHLSEHCVTITGYINVYNICKSSQRPLCYHNRLYKCILTTLYKKTFVDHLSDHCVTITGYANVY